MQEIELTVNGREYSEPAEPGVTLRDFLRFELGFTGTKMGCETGKCGVCTVLLDGEPVKSCLMLAHQAEGRDVTTIEGLDDLVESELHPIQEAFVDNFSSQCGYCIPGMISTSVGVLQEVGDDPDREEIRDALDGTICRCTGYRKIVDAIEDVAGTGVQAELD